MTRLASSLRLTNAPFIVAIFCVATAVLLAPLSAALVQATEPEINYEYVEEALVYADASAPAVEWLAPDTALARAFGPVEQDRVGTALARAWQTYAVATETGSAGALTDHFTGPAAERAMLAIETREARMVVLDIAAKPIFFHLDGSLLQIETTSTIARFWVDPESGLTHFRLSKDTNLSTLINDTIGWRILSHEWRTAEPIGRSRVEVEDQWARGINYYPAATPWSLFWQQFDLAVVEEDFALIRNLGASHVRVFLQRDVFLAQESSETALAHLESLLATAETAGLKVVPTLFDLRPGYGAVTWANDALYLRRVLPALETSDAVAYVDIKNEPDLDIENAPPGQVEAWARSMVGLSREIAPELAYTIGWSSAEAALLLADDLDLITYHDYAPVRESAASLQRVRAAANGVPIHITEIGETSLSVVGGRFPSSDTLQAQRLAERISALGAADGIFIWTLYDFQELDPAAIGPSPWVQALQRNFGLFTSDRTRKPAANTVSSAFEALANEG